MPMPGYDVRILSESGAELPRGSEGAVCIRLPRSGNPEGPPRAAPSTIEDPAVLDKLREVLSGT
ncbi:hypothetical protein GCM10017786_36680 [Amycolatopsis deserti]|uniref:DUF397 domain-containing protein n=1 Tax=Amycolatopsis deserti TaxID=185696 RepID=A0ABQ3J643_9PSEU|nr:hypothetical protein GCM10017786_36680 [Amycolatopsis deserti]